MPNRPHMLNWERNWCPATDQRGRSLHLLPLKARLLIAGSAERKDTGTATKLSWDCKVPFWSLHTNEPREQTNSIKGCRMAATPWHIGKASIGTFWTAAGLHLIRTGSTCILRFTEWCYALEPVVVGLTGKSHAINEWANSASLLSFSNSWECLHMGRTDAQICTFRIAFIATLICYHD